MDVEGMFDLKHGVTRYFVTAWGTWSTCNSKCRIWTWADSQSPLHQSPMCHHCIPSPSVKRSCSCQIAEWTSSFRMAWHPTWRLVTPQVHVCVQLNWQLTCSSTITKADKHNGSCGCHIWRWRVYHLCEDSSACLAGPCCSTHPCWNYSCSHKLQRMPHLICLAAYQTVGAIAKPVYHALQDRSSQRQVQPETTTFAS